MPPFSSSSIRIILTLIVFLAVLPALAIILYSGMEMRRQAIQDARREMLFLAETMGEVQKGITRSTRQLLATLARMDEIRMMDGPSASLLIQAIVKENPAYVNIAAVDPQGNVFASGVVYTPTNLADRAHFLGALNKKTFAPGEYIVTRVGQTIPSMAFAYPVLDDRGDVLAVLTAALNLDSFAHFFNLAKLPGDSFLAVTDRNGIRLFYYPLREGTNPIGHPIANAAWERSRGALEPGISVHEGSDGVRRIFAFQPVRIIEGQDPYIYMWAGIPEDMVLKPANQILLRNILMLILTAGLAIFIAQLVGGRTLMAPIKQLINATKAFAEGRMDARSRLENAPDELASLARAFDDMADTLVENQERLRTIADYTYDWEYWVGPAGDLQWMSPSCEKITGYPPAAFMADKTLLQRIVDETDFQRFTTHLEMEALEASIPHLEFRITHRSGRITWIDHHCIPIWNAVGVFLGRRVSNRDITARKQIEARLQQAQKMEAIGVLAGGIAHDFNNILFPIMGLSEMLMEDLPKGSPEHDNAGEIHTAARRAAGLVSRILSFSRQADHEKKAIHLQQVIMEAQRLIRATIPSHIDIRTDIQADCGPVLADPIHMHQVVINLITNAYHAVEENRGGISIRLFQQSLSADDLTGTTLEPGTYVVLSVVDTGCGIPPELIPRLFDPYFTTKSVDKGSGLGLSMVYGIVREHGGDIRVTTEAGKGADFKIFLPLHRKGDAVSAQLPPDIPPLGSERILLVDDEKAIVRIQVQALERLGYRVSAYTRSTEALKAFSADPAAYDLVMTDMAMPEMNGEELAKQVIALRRDIPVILFTGFSETMTAETTAAAGIKGFLYKPVVLSDMAIMIRKILDAREKAV